MDIRAARASDVDGLCELAPTVRPVDWVQSTLKRSLDPASRALWVVAERDGTLIGQGRVGWFPGRTEPDWPEYCLDAGWYLLGVYVHPTSRRQGVGHALTEARIHHAMACGAPWIRYWRDVDNVASAAAHKRWAFRPLDIPWWFPPGPVDPTVPMVLLHADLVPVI